MARLLAALILTCCCLSPAATAVVVVDASGAEGLATIAAGLAEAQSGDTVLVKPGTYTEQVSPKTGVTLRSEQGPVLTKIFRPDGGRGLSIRDVKDVVIDGFDIYAVRGAGKPNDALVMIWNSKRVTLRNCYIHDAGNDGDCVKFISVQDLLIEDCCIWNPSARPNKGIQECIDARADNHRFTLRGCWLFHDDEIGDSIIYGKGGCHDMLWENNIFGPSAGGGHGNVAVEAGHRNAGGLGKENAKPPYPSHRVVVRNNLFVGIKGEAPFGFYGVDTAMLYNNVFYQNQAVYGGLIAFKDNVDGSAGGPSLHTFSFNNIFYDNGDAKIYHDRSDGNANDLRRGHNLVFRSGPGGDLKLEDEAGLVLDQDPLFVAPEPARFDPAKGTAQIREILARFTVQPGSPAIDAGIDPFVAIGDVHPDAVADMKSAYDAFLAARPHGAGWDIGLHEFGAEAGGGD